MATEMEKDSLFVIKNNRYVCACVYTLTFNDIREFSLINRHGEGCVFELIEGKQVPFEVLKCCKKILFFVKESNYTLRR